MGALSPASQDRFLYIGLGLATCVVLGGMRQMLLYYRDDAKIPPSENKPQYITQEVEDSLKLSTLNKLLDSPNYSIQDSTITIICERALHDPTTIDVLLWHITRPDHDLREQGIRALTMMTNPTTVPLISGPDAYGALVKSLEYSITDYKHNEFDPDWDGFDFRDVCERGCLMILNHLIDKYGPDGLIEANFIGRWLAKEPWGEPKDRVHNFEAFLGRNQKLADLVLPLYRDKRGRNQLIKAKLLSESAGLAEVDVSRRDIRMIGGESTAGEDFDAMFVDSRRRRDRNSDADLRRRNREAIVMNDGTRPFERGDIIQRDR